MQNKYLKHCIWGTEKLGSKKKKEKKKDQGKQQLKGIGKRPGGRSFFKDFCKGKHRLTDQQ